MTLRDAQEGTEYIIQEILTDEMCIRDRNRGLHRIREGAELKGFRGTQGVLQNSKSLAELKGFCRTQRVSRSSKGFTKPMEFYRTRGTLWISRSLIEFQYYLHKSQKTAGRFVSAVFICQFYCQLYTNLTANFTANFTAARNFYLTNGPTYIIVLIR